MSCMLGVSPRPLTVAPFSVSAVCLLMLFLPWSSATSLAIISPLAFFHGPLPIRSRALTASAPCVLRYARQVLPPAPAACASVWHCWSAPARPPRSAPFPEPALVTKNVMSLCWAWVIVAPPSASSISDPTIDQVSLFISTSRARWCAADEAYDEAGARARDQPLV